VAQADVSLVLPAYNSAGYIADSVSRALGFFERQGIEAEVIVADDGSRDGTPDAVPANPRVKVVRNEANKGKGAALRLGMQQAGGRLRVFTDADLPYGLEPLLLARSFIEQRGFHAVIGDRTMPGSSYQSVGPARRVLSEAASFAFRTLVTGGIYDTQCGFKAFRGDVAQELFHISRIDRFAVDVELIYLVLKYRLDIKRIPVQLQRNASSSVRVLRDSARSIVDISRIRLNWARGMYRSPVLDQILAADLDADVLAVHGGG
jgi:dolichyl-phosphate beta-glucosyltransferase